MELIIKDKSNKLKFKCKKCGFCCDNTIIYLYPFDIFNLCRALDIKTFEFNIKYSKFIIDKEGIPRCVLSNRPGCPFKKDNKCEFYDLRPLRCRLFPVGRFYQEDKVQFILPKQQCIGFDTGAKQTIEEYMKEQDAEKFDKISEQWNRFIIGLKGKDILKNRLFPVVFRKVFYDFDDKLIDSYRKKLGKEYSIEDFMKNLYEIWETLSKNIGVITQN